MLILHIQQLPTSSFASDVTLCDVTLDNIFTLLHLVTLNGLCHITATAN